jgi:hypothetical protein
MGKNCQKYTGIVNVGGILEVPAISNALALLNSFGNHFVHHGH